MVIQKQDIVPVGRRLLIEPFKQASETTEGLIVSEGDGYASPVIGTVVKAGDGCVYKEGDLLMFRRYSVDSLKVYADDGEQEIYLLEESEVVAYLQSGTVGPPQREKTYSQIAEKKNATLTNSEGGSEEGQDRSEEGRPEEGRQEN